LAETVAEFPYVLYRPYEKVITTGKSRRSRPRNIGVSTVIAGFLLLIVVGTAILSLPAARQPDAEPSFITALFTATSAVAVTGLIVVDTGQYWSTFGQGVIVALIQLGGLGVMTASMFILIILRQPISFRNRFELREMSGMAHRQTVSGLVILIVLLTLGLEAIGMLAMGLRMGALTDGPLAWWHAGFTAVSAFNNAGFDNFGIGTGLTLFAHDPFMLAIIGLLAVLGGLGPLVLIDTATKRSWKRLSPNTRIVLTLSASLLVIGFLGVLGAEYAHAPTLGAFSVFDKMTNAMFQSVVARTSGFNTVIIGDLQDATQFFLLSLMFIGGATGSTAGGVKVATVAVLLLAMRAGVQGSDTASGFGRRFNPQVVYKAFAIVALGVLVVLAGTLLLTVTEDLPFRYILFEVVSAFGTVGLSTGITPSLSVPGELTIILIMFIGRLGPLTLAYALTQRSHEAGYRLPEEDIPLG
jgi:trk system potassium uptake protein TrkH